MKNDFNEIFTDIDDKLIADAKPVAQKPIELRPEPRSKSLVWKKCAAAAACLTVLAAAGGVIAVKVNPGQAVSPASSGNAALSNDTDSLLNELIESMTSSSVSSVISSSDSSDKANNSNPFAGMEFPDCELGEEFTYEGKLYKTISHGGSGGFGNNVDGSVFCNVEYSGVGVRREMIDGVDTLEFVAFVQNKTDSPIGLLGSRTSPDKPFLFKFDVNEGLVDTHHVFDDEVFDSVALFVQSGETYFQKVTFPVTEEKEYRFSMCVRFLDQGKYNESNGGIIAKNGGFISNRWADFGDKGIAYDDMEKLFGLGSKDDGLNSSDENFNNGSEDNSDTQPGGSISDAGSFEIPADSGLKPIQPR